VVKKDKPTPPPPPPDDGFTELKWDNKFEQFTVLDGGATIMYKAHVYSGDAPTGFALYDKGSLDLYMSFYQTKPADGASNPSECHVVGENCTYTTVDASCKLDAPSQDATVYCWIVGKGGGVNGTVFEVRIGSPHPHCTWFLIGWLCLPF